MILARVTGTVVSTQKHRKLEGAKLLLVQPLTLDDAPRGAELLAVDGAGAGVGEKVLIVLEGRSASDAIGQKAAPVDAAIVGIVDSVDLPSLTNRNSARSSAKPLTGILAGRRNGSGIRFPRV